MNWPEAIVVIASIAGICFILWCYLRSEWPLRAPPSHGFWSRVLRDAVCPPVRARLAGDQDTDAPDGAAQCDEQMDCSTGMGSEPFSAILSERNRP